jgi:hypothetical protein
VNADRAWRRGVGLAVREQNNREPRMPPRSRFQKADRMGKFDRRTAGQDGAGAPGGPPKAEPGAGSAGRGAAGAALILRTAQFGNAAPGAGC